MEIISKKDAKIKGFKKYYTGGECLRGHVSERYISGGCVECSNEKNHSEYTRQYYKDHKSEYSERGKKHYRENIEDYKARSHVNYENDKESVSSRHKKYIKDNRLSLNEKIIIRKKTDIQFKLATGLRDRTIKAVKGEFKGGSAVSDLGCSIGEFKFYIEGKFKPGMSWDNWSKTGWHLDHIKPLSSFDLTNRKEFLVACNYKNIQPLWAADNLSKAAKYEPIV